MKITDTEMRKALYNGIVEFSFRKKNGECRKATGTTSLDTIRDINDGFTDINGRGIRRSKVGCVAFFDVNKKEWRSYTEGTLIAVFKVTPTV